MDKITGTPIPDRPNWSSEKKRPSDNKITAITNFCLLSIAITNRRFPLMTDP